MKNFHYKFHSPAATNLTKLIIFFFVKKKWKGKKKGKEMRLHQKDEYNLTWTRICENDEIKHEF